MNISVRCWRDAISLSGERIKANIHVLLGIAPSWGSTSPEKLMASRLAELGAGSFHFFLDA